MRPGCFPLRRFLAGLLLTCAAHALAQPSSVPANPLEGAALIQALRQGGMVLYIRHAATDFSRNDEKMTSYEDCASQRNLTDPGRAEARAIGAAMSKLAIPLGRVLASPFCRTVETATLVFGRAEKSNEVRGGPASSDDPKRYEGLRRLLSVAPDKGANLAIASHGNPFYAVAGPPYLQEGETAVLRPLGAKGFEVVARLKLADWEILAGQAGLNR